MKRVILSLTVIAFFIHVPTALSGTCSAWERFHGTFCQEDANNAADELLYHDKYGISNKYTYMKYVYCPVESTQLLSVPPDGAWEVSAYTIDTVTVCAKDANYDDANGD